MVLTLMRPEVSKVKVHKPSIMGHKLSFYLWFDLFWVECIYNDSLVLEVL